MINGRRNSELMLICEEDFEAQVSTPDTCQKTYIKRTYFVLYCVFLWIFQRKEYLFN